MTQDQAFEMIRSALEATTPGISEKVSIETDLKEDGVLDSLDRMNFLFELEHMHGDKIEEITDTFDDFRVATLVGFLTGK